MADADALTDLTFTTNKGEEFRFSDVAGHPVLIVNTASKCGFTPQYAELQELHERFAEQGLIVVGFPCDQFAHQEPGDDQAIEQFCSLNYGVTFPLAAKSDVNGPQTHPVFAFLKSRATGLLGSRIKWNFTKFLVAPDGTTVQRFAPKTPPHDLIPEIERLLDVS